MNMYKIIGADGQEYGPVTREQICQWIAEGRADAQTKVQPEGAAEWQLLGSIPEFAEVFAAKLAPIAPSTSSAPPVFAASAVDAVNMPAIGLIVTAILGFVAHMFSVVWTLFVGRMQSPPPEMPPGMERMTTMVTGVTGAIGIVTAILGVIMSVLVLYGALRMKKLSGYNWAMTAAILALIPCIGPCCLAGIPIGIWALVVLSKPEVKDAFH
jgi:hypothetical protein